MLVYRNTSKQVPGRWLVDDLSRRLQAGPSAHLAALLRAGELECALSDLAHPLASQAATLTDATARTLLGVNGRDDDRATVMSSGATLPELTLSEPEGYAYYAVDPRRYAELAASHASRQRSIAILGVRSIGTSLSAVVQVEFERRGVQVERCTVRPRGHPWQRTLEWSPLERGWLTRHLEHSTFIVVDEGPGLSGSTFLSVSEALVALGVRPNRIQLFCSHEPDSSRLLAPDAQARWARFSHRAARPWAPPESSSNLSAGVWRSYCYPSEAQWPASWTQMERLKYLSPDGRTLSKFSGFPPYDEEILTRATLLAEANWSPPLGRQEPGFLAGAWQKGRPAQGLRDVGLALPRLAAYSAFRLLAFATAHARTESLETMTRNNVAEALQVDVPREFRLEVVNPVFVDGRMMPHEWLILGETRLLKTDSAHHAEDHFHPGVTDIAWDLAGASVEWQLDRAATSELAARFRALTGDDVSARLPAYELAYCSFRAGYVELAKLSSSPRERRRLDDSTAYYVSRMRALLHSS